MRKVKNSCSLLALHLNTQRERGGEDGGGEVKRDGWRDGGREGEIERGGETDRRVLCKVGFCIWVFISGCFQPDARQRS